jgi:hypothetical protein
VPAGLGHIALNREALAEAERVLAERLPNPAPSEDVADAIRAYLATVRLTGFGGQCGEATLRLASMKVGDVILADQSAFKQFAGAKKTARRLMAEPQASWSLTAVGSLHGAPVAGRRDATKAGSTTAPERLGPGGDACRSPPYHQLAEGRDDVETGRSQAPESARRDMARSQAPRRLSGRATALKPRQCNFSPISASFLPPGRVRLSAESAPSSSSGRPPNKFSTTYTEQI